MKNCIFVVFILVSSLAFSQENFVRKGQAKVNFLAPSFNYEFGLSKKTSLNTQLGLGLGYSYSDSKGSDFSAYPYLSAAFRYYYNFEKRAKKNKNTLNNSANYLTVRSFVMDATPIFKNTDFGENFTFVVGPAWGMQRTYKSGFNLDLNLGLGVEFYDVDPKITSMINLSIGWVLNRKK